MENDNDDEISKSLTNHYKKIIHANLHKRKVENTLINKKIDKQSANSAACRRRSIAVDERRLQRRFAGSEPYRVNLTGWILLDLTGSE